MRDLRGLLFHGTAAPEIHTLSLHDALPIFSTLGSPPRSPSASRPPMRNAGSRARRPSQRIARSPGTLGAMSTMRGGRSEEHTSELQSRRELVCRLLLEKKKYRFGTCREFAS